MKSQKLFDCLKFYHIFAPANLNQRFTVAQFLFNLHTHSELYFYLPDSALIYDFILVQNLNKKKTRRNPKIEMQTWLLDPTGMAGPAETPVDSAPSSGHAVAPAPA